jgi:16S rRNA (adenine1518-N6/adenine1519-N6)-dimethyltransferase
VSRTSTASSSLPDPVPGIPHRPVEIDQTLQALGLRPSRRFGQSFLTDPFVADAEVALLMAPPGTPVVEIGGGLGVLTEALLRRGIAPLTVVEREPAFARYLHRQFGDRIRVVEADALSFDIDPAALVIGNLPYSVGTPLLEHVWRSGVARFVGMLQREVVDRLSAAPRSKAYGRLTIEAALYGTVEPYRLVPSSAFHPTPEVESRMFAFQRRAGPLPVRSVERLDRAVAALFSARRKQLANLLGRLLPGGIDPDEIARAADWPEGWRTQRPEELEPAAFFRLVEVLEDRRMRRRPDPGVPPPS